MKLDPIIHYFPKEIFVWSDPQNENAILFSKKYYENNEIFLSYFLNKDDDLAVYEDEIFSIDLVFSEPDCDNTVHVGIDVTDLPNIKRIFNDSITSCVLNIGSFQVPDIDNIDQDTLKECFADFEDQMSEAEVNVLNVFSYEDMDIVNGHPIPCGVFLRFHKDAPYVFINPLVDGCTDVNSGFYYPVSCFKTVNQFFKF